MGESLSDVQRNILAWVLSLAVITLVGVVGFTIREVAELQKRLPKDYVLLEQYRCDQRKVEATLTEMDRKIDTLLMRAQ